MPSHGYGGYYRYDIPRVPQVVVNEEKPKHILGPDGKPLHTPGKVRFGFQPSPKEDDDE